MTTNGTTTRDVYEYLEDLQAIRPSDETRRYIAEVRAITETVRPLAEGAKRFLADQEARSQIVRAQLVTADDISDPGEVDQGLWDLIFSLSGARELWNALQNLTEMCDPDRVTPEDITQARTALDDASVDCP